MIAVAIVVPIFNGRAHVARCVESVLAHATGDFQLILVDDASTDADVRADLIAFARRDGRVRVLTNEKNLGFPGTANRGMRAAAGLDVLLLNSDTEVYAGFLDRLREAAHADARTGILSPFSNNATICSVPQIFRDNPLPEGHTWASFAEVVAASSRRARPELPTAVGFCLYLRKEVLARGGLFDEVAFGRGFGEENDLCQRARKAGFRVRLCDDVFVRHLGKASFGDEGRELERRNAAVLEARHPGYDAEIARFARQEPLRKIHDELRFQTSRLREDARSAALFVLHESPFAKTAAGTEQHVLDLLRALRLPRALIAWPRRDSIEIAEIVHGQLAHAAFFRFPLPHAADRFAIEDQKIPDELVRICRLFGVRFAHLHHLMHWPLSLARALDEAGIPCAMTVHDYYLACPNWTLLDLRTRRECACAAGAPEKICDEGCVADFVGSMNLPIPAEPLKLRRAHRAAALDSLSRARALIFPSHAAKSALGRLLPLDKVRCEVIEHGRDLQPAEPRAPAGPLLRAAIVGGLSQRFKGADDYPRLLALLRDAPIEWHFYGRATATQRRQLSSAHFHGRYQRDQIADLLRADGIDVQVLLPGWAETFSFVLSEAAIAGVPSIVSDRGAPAERVRRDGLGEVVGSVEEAAMLLRSLDAQRLSRLRARLAGFRHRTNAESAADHLALYRSLGFSTADATLDSAALHEIYDRRVPRERGLRGRARSLLPPLLRERVRDALWSVQVRELSPRTLAKKALATDLQLERVSSSAALFRSAGRDPQLILPVSGLPSASIGALSFQLRRQSAEPAFAQLYWTHAPGEPFEEARSARLPLDGRPGEKRDYRFALDLAPWRAGARIHRLRFDPIDRPGLVELGTIRFEPL